MQILLVTSTQDLFTNNGPWSACRCNSDSEPVAPTDRDGIMPVRSPRWWHANSLVEQQKPAGRPRNGRCGARPSALLTFAVRRPIFITSFSHNGLHCADAPPVSVEWRKLAYRLAISPFSCEYFSQNRFNYMWLPNVLILYYNLFN
jgi:hypothetical protein